MARVAILRAHSVRTNFKPITCYRAALLFTGVVSTHSAWHLGSSAAACWSTRSHTPGSAMAPDSKHMSPAMQALCYFYRNPPAESGVKPQPYKAIPKLIQHPHMKISRVKMAVKRFMAKKSTRALCTGSRCRAAAKCI